MVDAWTFKSQKELLKTRVFSATQKDYVKPDGHTPFNAYVLQCPNWVNIIAFNSAKEILFERQFRFGSNQIEVEIPGGVIEPNEPPLEAAKRELLEETGYQSEKWEFLGVVHANPAIMSNSCFSFACYDAVSTGKTQLDADEDIEFFFESQEKCREYLRHGTITNVFVVAAFQWLALKTILP